MVLGSMLIIAISLLLFTQYKLSHTDDRIEKMEMIDSIGVSHYKSTIASLKRSNNELSDSLDAYKNKVRLLTLDKSK